MIPRPSDGIDLRAEFLLLASSSVLSSFALRGQDDVGVRLSTRLLLPLALSGGDGAGSGGDRAAATVADVLGRHRPRSDAEARDLLNLARPLIEGGSRLVAESADLLALCRSRDHGAAERPGGAAHWLLRGAEAQSYLPHRGGEAGEANMVAAALSSCGRRLTGLCTAAAGGILASNLLLRGEAEGEDAGEGADELVRRLDAGREIARSVSEDESFGTREALAAFPAVRLLGHVVATAESAAAGDDADAASRIVRCLEDQSVGGYEILGDGENGQGEGGLGDGAVVTLAPPSMWGDLIGIAYGLLVDRDAYGSVSWGGTGIGASTKAGRPSASFDVGGIHTLMARFAQLTFGEWGGGDSSNYGFSGGRGQAAAGVDDTAVRTALCEGLVRAFVVQNGLLQVDGRKAGDVERIGVGIVDSNVGGRRGGESLALERSVELMLGPSV